MQGRLRGATIAVDSQGQPDASGTGGTQLLTILRPKLRDLEVAYGRVVR